MSLGGLTLDNRNGVVNSGGELWVSYEYSNHNNPSVTAITNQNGVIASANGMSIQTTNFDNNSGLVTAGGALVMDADKLINTNSDAFVASDRWANTSQTKGGIYAGEGDGSGSHSHYTAGESSINVGSLNNENGRIVSTGKKTDLHIISNGAINNNNGTIDSAKSLTIDQYGLFNNGSGQVTAAEDVNVSARDFSSDNDGDINAGHNVNIHTSGTFNNSGTISAARPPD